MALASETLKAIVQAVLSIVQAGRSAIVYWFFDFYMLFGFFYQYMTPQLKRRITIAASVIILAVGSLFVTITISRFDREGSSSNSMDSVIGYAGQHVDNFCTMFVMGDNSPVQFDRVFPLFSRYVLHEPFDLDTHYQKTASFVKANVNVFDTFGAEVYLDLGWFGYIFLLLLLVMLAVYLRSRWKEIEFHQIFFVVLMEAFFVKGIFAWPFVGHYTTMAILLMLPFVYLFKYKFKI